MRGEKKIDSVAHRLDRHGALVVNVRGNNSPPFACVVSFENREEVQGLEKEVARNPTRTQQPKMNYLPNHWRQRAALHWPPAVVRLRCSARSTVVYHPTVDETP